MWVVQEHAADGVIHTTMSRGQWGPTAEVSRISASDPSAVFCHNYSQAVGLNHSLLATPPGCCYYQYTTSKVGLCGFLCPFSVYYYFHKYLLESIFLLGRWKISACPLLFKQFHPIWLWVKGTVLSNEKRLDQLLGDTSFMS